MTESNAQPPAANTEKLEDFALHELRRQHNHEDIVMGLCQRTGGKWTWVQAQHFLDEVYTNHHSELAAQEKWYALLVGMALMIDGLAVLTIGIIGMLRPIFAAKSMASSDHPADNFLVSLVFAVVVQAWINPMYFVLFLGIIATGLGMLAKGILKIIRIIQ